MVNPIKAQILAPEEVGTEGWYTFNLNPLRQHISYAPRKRWNEVYKDIQQTISKFIDEAEIEGNVEVSRKGRIHMHGYIKFKNIIDFYLKLPSILADNHIEIDTIADMKTWEIYCTKQQTINKYCTFIKQEKMVLIQNQFLAGI